MDDGGPYERYYADRQAAGERTVLWPWVLLAVVVPLLVVRSFVIPGESAEATATQAFAAPVPAPVAAVTATDGEFRVGSALEPGDYGTPGPGRGSACEHVRVGPDGGQVARAVLNGPATARLIEGETVTFAGGCAWSRR